MPIRYYFPVIERTITRLYSVTRLLRISTDKNFVPILAYHGICNLPAEISRMHPYSVPPPAFEEQMEFIYKNKYSVIKLEDFICSINEKQKIPQNSVVITFDDGFKNNYTNALPVLRKYEFPATVFLASDYVGSNDIFPWLKKLYEHDSSVRDNLRPLSWEEVLEMSQDRIAFGSHTCSHSNFRLMSVGDFEKEIRKSKDAIEKQINKAVELFSYPFSFPKYRKQYKSAVDEAKDTLKNNGFSGACTTVIGTNSLESDPFCLKRIQIMDSDNFFHFKAKLKGDYNWAGAAQKTYQKIIEPLLEKRSHQ